MNANNLNIEFLSKKLNSLTNKLAGFGVELTENGFILTLLLHTEDEDGSLKENRAALSFGSETRIENIIDLLIEKIKLQKL